MNANHFALFDAGHCLCRYVGFEVFAAQPSQTMPGVAISVSANATPSSFGPVSSAARPRRAGLTNQTTIASAEMLVATTAAIVPNF